MSKIYLLLLFSALGISAFGQTDKLKLQAEKYMEAVVSKDYNKIVERSYPGIVEMGGGTKMAVADLKTERETIENQEIFYLGSTVGNVGDIKKSQDELQTILPVKIDIRFKNNEYESNTHLLAISADNGKSWSFVDLEKYDHSSLKEFVPSLHPDLIIPLNLPYQKKK